MSIYNNRVAKMADQEQDATVQRELGKAYGVSSPTPRDRLKNIVDNVYYGFIEELFDSAFYKDKENEECYLRKFLKENEDYLIPILREMIRTRVREKELSKFPNSDYYDSLGSIREEVKLGNKSHYVGMRLCFVPAKMDTVNKFRLEVTEKLSNISNFPYIIFSVDIGEDGTITYNQPVEVNFRIEEQPADTEKMFIKVSKQIAEVRDALVELFDKIGVKKYTERTRK